MSGSTINVKRESTGRKLGRVLEEAESAKAKRADGKVGTLQVYVFKSQLSL